ncbi:hypothetical protein NKDENANG_01201 [Candidatus Entotheonellaceae bacterium PAL068K]
MPPAFAEEFSAVLRRQYHTHRAIAPQDIYKLIYQRVFGPEHLIDDLGAAHEQLYLEVLRLSGRAVVGPLLEPLSPLLCRVNLQPFIQGGGSIEPLWQAFRHTARAFQPGSLVDVQRTWSLFVATPWAQPYGTERLEQFWLRMATADFPPVHHSHDYAKANAPHYRVVLRTLVAEHLGYTLP